MDKTGDGQSVVMKDDSSGIIFDNPTILREFGKIVNGVSAEQFLDIVPKGKLKQLKWAQVFNCLKQAMFDDMVQEMTSMWKDENMPEKLELLEKQKEKFSEIETSNTMWRPQLADVKAQLRSHDAANLRKQKKALETLAQKYEAEVSNLQKIVTAKRGYLKALQLKMKTYQKKNDDLVKKNFEKIQNHCLMVDALSLSPKVNIEDIRLPEDNVEDIMLPEVNIEEIRLPEDNIEYIMLPEVNFEDTRLPEEENKLEC